MWNKWNLNFKIKCNLKIKYNFIGMQNLKLDENFKYKTPLN